MTIALYHRLYSSSLSIYQLFCVEIAKSQLNKALSCNRVSNVMEMFLGGSLSKKIRFSLQVLQTQTKIAVKNAKFKDSHVRG